MLHVPWKILISFLIATTMSRAEVRMWEGRNGSRTEAELVKQIGSKVLLKKKDGKTVSVPIQKLSDQDQHYLKELRNPAGSPAVKAVHENEQSIQIGKELEAGIKQEKLPGMIAAIVSSEGILSIAATGVRKDGAEQAMEMTDQLHMGSCTKAMTSVLMATLVSDGLLTWETTLIDVFPSLEKRIHADYHDLTVWQLLTHRSRIPGNAENWWVYQDMELKERRLTIMKENLKDTPQVAEGKYEYSNLGYMVAGCMAEELTGETWEDLIQERIFEPLGMGSAGFGPPGTRGKTDQPWGHNRKDGEWNPRQFDNAEALGPAGTIHCSIEDWTKFIALQLSDSSALSLDRALLDKLITPIGHYAAGWGIHERSWGKGRVLAHTGSNTMWYAVVWAAPELNRAYLVVTNSCDDHSDKICDQMIWKLIQMDQQIDG